MKLDNKLELLPLSKSHPEKLKAIFGTTDLSPMWVADSEFQVADPIQRAIIDRVSGSGFGYEYKPSGFFEAQKKWYLDQYGLNLEMNQLLFSPSIGASMVMLIEEYSNENEGVIIQPPVFMQFKEVVIKSRRNVVKNSLFFNGSQYEMDFDLLEKQAAVAQNKVLMICNPHNPVGRVWTLSELSRIVAICEKHGLLLISDEIHKDVVLFNNHYHSVLEFVDVYDRMVVLTSESKTFNLVSLLDSMAIVPNPQVYATLSKALKKYNLGRTNALSRIALETAYRTGQSWLQSLIPVIEENVRVIEKNLADSAINLVKPEGTYQVWLDFRSLYKDTKTMFREITQNSGIGLNAGHWFGREGAGFMRMSIGTTPAKVEKAIQALKQAAINARTHDSAFNRVQV